MICAKRLALPAGWQAQRLILRGMTLQDGEGDREINHGTQYS